MGELRLLENYSSDRLIRGAIGKLSSIRVRSIPLMNREPLAHDTSITQKTGKENF